MEHPRGEKLTQEDKIGLGFFINEYKSSEGTRRLTAVGCSVCREDYWEDQAHVYYELPRICNTCNNIKDTKLFKLLENES